MKTPRTCVLQSHRSPLPAGWYERCLDSVQSWAAQHGLEYRFVGDTLFDSLPLDIRDATREQLVIAADVGRLRWCREVLAESSVDRVVWLDADVLVRDPDSFVLSNERCQVGREIWVDRAEEKPKSWKHVHNAFLLFRKGSSFLEFYLETAESLIRKHKGTMVPQFVGPKLLTALHNVVGFSVEERAGMLSPAVADDILAGGGDCLDLFVRRMSEIPAALNLSGSVAAHRSEGDFDALIDLLMKADAFGLD